MTRSSKPAPPVEPGPVDVSLAATLIGLIAFGVVMVYSASAVYAMQKTGDSAGVKFESFHYVLLRVPVP